MLSLHNGIKQLSCQLFNPAEKRFSLRHFDTVFKKKVSVPAKKMTTASRCCHEVFSFDEIKGILSRIPLYISEHEGHPFHPDNISDRRLHRSVPEQAIHQVRQRQQCKELSDLPAEKWIFPEFHGQKNRSSIRPTQDQLLSKAYFQCHTDITIPYDELLELAAVEENGKETTIIENGRFVLEGVEELNRPFEDS